MHLARGALEQVRLTVVGEVSEFNDKPGYKAAYFSLADQGATMSAMMWKNRYLASGVTLRQGMLVEVRGRFSAYEAKGRMQFVVDRLSVAGEGALRMRVHQIAERLAREGLMDDARKRPLPAYPTRIGLVTSPRGKAVWDVIRTFRRRWPAAELLFAGVPVEGERAPQNLIDGLAAVVAGGAEVVVLGRGGGSYEDLMPFNDERLARAVAACPVPVVTGIGHEPDNTLCDMVADRRASTPTGAAGAATPDAAETAALLDHDASRLSHALGMQVTELAHGLDVIASRPVFADEHALTGALEQACDTLDERLRRAIPAMMEQRRVRLAACESRLRALAPRMAEGPAARVAAQRVRLEDLAQRLLREPASRVAHQADRLDAVAGRLASPSEAQVAALAQRLGQRAQEMLDPYQAQVGALAKALDGLSPVGTLARGYSVTRTAGGEVVRSIGQAPPGAEIAVRVADGTLRAQVTSVAAADGDQAGDSARP